MIKRLINKISKKALMITVGVLAVVAMAAMAWAAVEDKGVSYKGHTAFCTAERATSEGIVSEWGIRTGSQEDWDSAKNNYFRGLFKVQILMKMPDGTVVERNVVRVGWMFFDTGFRPSDKVLPADVDFVGKWFIPNFQTMEWDDNNCTITWFNDLSKGYVESKIWAMSKADYDNGQRP